MKCDTCGKDIPEFTTAGGLTLPASDLARAHMKLHALVVHTKKLLLEQQEAKKRVVAQ